jgi:hypothetical protein
VLLDTSDPQRDERAGKLISLIRELMAAFPGELPDIFEPGQAQRRTLRCYRDWSQLCQAAGVDASFMVEFWV